MYISLKPIFKKYNLYPKGVIHVGSNDADEHGHYMDCGIERFVYIEPCKDAFDALSKRITDSRAILINVACGAEEKEMTMYVSHQNKGMSNSLLEPVLHLSQHPEVVFDDKEVVKMTTLDSLPIKQEEYSLLVMDVEGYESEVIKGAKKTLSNIDVIYSEIQRGETRKGNMLIDEFEEMLLWEGFEKVEEYWPSPNFTWGDAVFVRRKLFTSEDLDML